MSVRNAGQKIVVVVAAGFFLCVLAGNSYALVNYSNHPDLARAMQFDPAFNGGDMDKSDRARAEQYYLSYLRDVNDSFQQARVHAQLGALYAVAFNPEKGRAHRRGTAWGTQRPSRLQRSYGPECDEGILRQNASRFLILATPQKIPHGEPQPGDPYVFADWYAEAAAQHATRQTRGLMERDRELLIGIDEVLNGHALGGARLFRTHEGIESNAYAGFLIGIPASVQDQATVLPSSG